MSNLIKRTAPDRSKIDTTNAYELKYWLRALSATKDDLLAAVEKVGNGAATVRKELQRQADNAKVLEADDFPVSAEGKKIKKQDGTQIVEAEDPALAADVAERLNDDEARREEDKWSA